MEEKAVLGGLLPDFGILFFSTLAWCLFIICRFLNLLFKIMPGVLEG